MVCKYHFTEHKVRSIGIICNILIRRNRRYIISMHINPNYTKPANSPFSN